MKMSKYRKKPVEVEIDSLYRKIVDSQEKENFFVRRSTEAKGNGDVEKLRIFSETRYRYKLIKENAEKELYKILSEKRDKSNDFNKERVLTMMGYNTDIRTYSPDEIDCLFEDLESVNNITKALIDGLWDKDE